MIDGLLLQRGHLFPWTPVCFAIGIGWYFSLLSEPSPWLLCAAFTSGILILLFSRFLGVLGGPLACGTALVLLGLALAGARTHQVTGPVLAFRYYGPIEGRIVNIDRSASDAIRLTLDRVVLERMARERTPERVRVSLHGDVPFDPEPGAVIMTTGHLSAPNGPVEPMGFDFRRNAWFQRIGAVGYTRVPVLYLERDSGALPIFSARMDLASHVRAAMPGESGAFAAAIMTGDRSGMGQDTLQALRDSNLAHLLAISGLHMGLLAGFLFAGLRILFLLAPPLALRWPIKKLAALGALFGAAGYLALSGGNIATERAFIMVAVALFAAVLDRRVLSLRAVAMAALIVLVLWPEALLGPGFQMSFAATTALVAVFALAREVPERWRAKGWLAPVLAVCLSSFVAGAATAPIGMAHFNQMSHYGLLANLVSVPLMGLVVMPAAVLAAILMPFGLDWIALWPMRLGLDWILGVAHSVASWDGAVGYVATPLPVVLPLLTLGALFIILWQGRSRWLGVLSMIAAAVVWQQSARPLVLISQDGGLVGVMTNSGRALSKSRGAGFVAQNWLENDGDGAVQSEAAARWRTQGGQGIARYDLGGIELAHVQGKRALKQFKGCDKGDIVVASTTLPASLPCLVLDPKKLSATGAMALIDGSEGLQILTVRDVSGHRLWHGSGQAPAAPNPPQYVLIRPTSLP
ncbi:ComEC/Rec2 family competence protein [Puniceibacterium sediminis]|uniref:Competence protein ComEC n=1 Tax=Puniceibacterium sediminis TaxID=1608407 RepID=A0A238W2Z8_9RHOB|nr:ComEC/Rec2 family competence protein [Puniceibacterium sediminis]SNR40985.1 competence protein ComEC [Puniceibacterium sediminis]